MTFQPTSDAISWKIHFQSGPQKVYAALATDDGRAAYWAESAIEKDNAITFRILNYQPYTGRILKSEPPRQFSVEYFGTIVDFTLEEDGNGGTDLTLLAGNVKASMHSEMTAGWVSVLMAMKAYVDHGVDLRNHDESRTWSSGYADN